MNPAIYQLSDKYDPPLSDCIKEVEHEEGVDYYVCKYCGDRVYYDSITANREDEQLLCIDCWEDQYA